jgi:hypothetical protein
MVVVGILLMTVSIFVVKEKKSVRVLQTILLLYCVQKYYIIQARVVSTAVPRLIQKS